jgi:hypothetical protein
MKRHMFDIVVGVSVFLMAGGLVAGEETLLKWDADAKALQKEWAGKIKYETVDGKLSALVDSKSYITSKKFIPVEAGKKYTLTGSFKSLGENLSRTYYGFICYDKNKKHVITLNSNVVLDSGTTLAEECKKGDKTLVIKANNKWKAGYAIAFNAKDDFSDLPNREVAYKITKVAAKDGNMELQLSAPVKKAYPAGTKVRMHSPAHGTYLYTAIAGAMVPKSMKAYSGTATLAKPGQIGFQYFRPGTAFVKVVILPNYGKKKDEKLLCTDLTLKVTE